MADMRVPLDEVRPTRRERLAVGVFSSLQRAGLHKLPYLSVMRWLGKRMLLRGTQSPRVRSIASGLGQGLILRVLPSTPQSFWMGTHEPEMQAMIRAQIKPGMVVYDCGANVGYHSVIFSALVGPAGHVFAFEPSPESLECLQIAGELNGFGHLTIVPKAVWSQTELLRFARGSGNRSLVNDHVEYVFGASVEQQRLLDIPATTLDDFVYEEGNPPPNFIKMDIEGSEGKAMAGASRLLGEFRPPILLEVHGAPGHEAMTILKGLNYAFTDIATGAALHSADEFANWISNYPQFPARPQVFCRHRRDE